MIEEKEYPVIINELTKFRIMILNYFDLRKSLGRSNPYRSVDPKEEEKKNEVRQEINQKIPIIKHYFKEVGMGTVLHGRAPAVIGGYPFSVDIFGNLFDVDSPFKPGVDKAIDAIDQCIGQYRYMVQTKQSIVDLEVTPIFQVINLISSNLRKCFKKPPTNETEVQDEVEKILSIRQVNANRETVAFPYSSKSYKPDFVLEDFDTVIEIKLCNSTQDEKKIIAEINDDIQAYLSKYKLAIFFVYDMGIIRNVDLFQNDLTRSGNVSIHVVKH